MERFSASKIIKYEALTDAVGQYYEQFSAHPIATGSTGLIHERILRCLMGSGMPKENGFSNGCQIVAPGTCDVD